MACPRPMRPNPPKPHNSPSPHSSLSPLPSTPNLGYPPLRMSESTVSNGHPRGHDLRAAPSNHDTHDLAISFDPVLHQACNGRLGQVEWFRASWQRGGAATGFSTWTMND